MMFLKQYRTLRAMEQRELAQQSGVSLATISRLECNTQAKASMETVIALADSLDIGIDTLRTDPQQYIPRKQ